MHSTAFFPRNAAVFTAAALLASCQSPRTARIQENPALFASLDAPTQELIRQGLIDYGFTPELVRLAIGRPNRVMTADTPDGAIETWVYKNFLYANANAVTVGVTPPGTRPLGNVLSSAAPGGPGLNTTRAGPGQASVAEENAVGTLFLDFLSNRVVKIRIEP